MFLFQIPIGDASVPTLVSIERNNNPVNGLPVEGLTGVSEITITFEAADSYTTVTVSDLFVRACYEGKCLDIIILAMSTQL